MKKWTFLFLFIISFFRAPVEAFPTSLYWTTCNTEVVPTGQIELGISDYFTVFNRPKHGQRFATDIGFTLGLFSWEDLLSSEIGIDYLAATDYPFFFNGKLSLSENKLFRNSPSFAFGIFNIGTKAGQTNFNTVDLVLGKTLPNGGSFYIGGFVGSRTMGKNRAGAMVGYMQGFCDAVDGEGAKYQKWTILADLATGRNALGGGGLGIMYSFSSRIALITGPNWFTDADFNGRWKWTIQFDILLSAFDSAKMTFKRCTPSI